MRPDLPLSNNEKQGHGHKPLYLQSLSLNKQPELVTNLSINSSATVNPDRDVQGTGSYHIQVNPANLGLAGVHSPTGAFLGDISMDRLRVLQLAHKQVVHEAPSDLAGSLANLLSRYKSRVCSHYCCCQGSEPGSCLQSFPEVCQLPHTAALCQQIVPA